MGTPQTSTLAPLAGALTVGAGLVHATAAGSHQDQRSLVALFCATAVAQVVVGVLAFRTSRRSLTLVLAVNVAAIGAWTVSRTAGIPWVAALENQQAIGVHDLVATIMETAAAAAAGLVLFSGRFARPAGYSPLWALAVLPAAVGMVAPHDHSAGSGHQQQHVPGVAALGTDPIFAGADTSGASEAQLKTAQSLIAVTRESVASRFPDMAALRAAGYRSIGDGFPFTRFEHFVNTSYLTDGREIDPGHIESVVVEGTGAEARVVSAMYILEDGKTMADVPDIAGELTTWHDHQNLCWEPSGLRLAGVFVNGRCFPGGTLKATPPMLHVWLTDHACGPFAGIEGHPAGECAGHGH